MTKTFNTTRSLINELKYLNNFCTNKLDIIKTRLTKGQRRRPRKAGKKIIRSKYQIIKLVASEFKGSSCVPARGKKTKLYFTLLFKVRVFEIQT